MDSVLQYHTNQVKKHCSDSHNPCFSGQCFAIKQGRQRRRPTKWSHNPCFSGQCFAMILNNDFYKRFTIVTILVLVDSVLQYVEVDLICTDPPYVTILVLVDSVLQ